MRHTGYTWFCTHTTLVALFVVQIRFRVGVHLVEQIESELEVLGVVVSCLVVPWPTPPSIFYVFCYSVFRQDIPYVRFVILVSDLHRILEALVLMTPFLG